MGRYIISRVGQCVLTIWAATAIVFVLSRSTGDPALLLLPTDATLKQLVQIRHELGLDAPLWKQYVLFLGHALHGNFGQSLVYRGQSAAKVVLARLPASLELAGISSAVVLLVGIPAGVYAAGHHNRLLDRVISSLAALAQALPNFWFGTILILLLSVEIHVFPAAGKAGWTSFVLPVATVVVSLFAGLARITRSAMLEELKTDYVKFARTKGASERRVLWKHAFRNAGVTVLAFAGLMLLNMLNAIVIVETVFAWPGIGQLIIQSVEARDFPVVQFIVVLMATIYALGNLLIDLGYLAIDPRIRYGR
jgi:peptide/nickel transport system permease protein